MNTTYPRTVNGWIIDQVTDQDRPAYKLTREDGSGLRMIRSEYSALSFATMHPASTVSDAPKPRPVPGMLAVDIATHPKATMVAILKAWECSEPLPKVGGAVYIQWPRPNDGVDLAVISKAGSMYRMETYMRQ